MIQVTMPITKTCGVFLVLGHGNLNILVDIGQGTKACRLFAAARPSCTKVKTQNERQKKSDGGHILYCNYICKCKMSCIFSEIILVAHLRLENEFICLSV